MDGGYGPSFTQQPPGLQGQRIMKDTLARKWERLLRQAMMNESALAALYAQYAELFPEHAGVWTALSRAELKHADAFLGLLQKNPPPGVEAAQILLCVTSNLNLIQVSIFPLAPLNFAAATINRADSISIVESLKEGLPWMARRIISTRRPACKIGRSDFIHG